MHCRPMSALRCHAGTRLDLTEQEIVHMNIDILESTIGLTNVSNWMSSNFLSLNPSNLSYLILQQTTNSMLIILNFSYHSQPWISLITSLTLKIL